MSSVLPPNQTEEMFQQWPRWRLPVLIYLICTGVYMVVAGPRLLRPTADNHFVHLAMSLMHWQLGVINNHPPGHNDWACFDELHKTTCAPSAWPPPWGRGPKPHEKWYVSFPPFPALLILPVVWVWGTATLDALFWVFWAGLSPTILFILLRTLREKGYSQRTVVDDLILTFLYAFGSVYFFVAVQGSVWFAASVLISVMVPLLMLVSLEGGHPWISGCVVGAMLLTRPNTIPLALIPILEILQAHPSPTATPSTSARGALHQLLLWLRTRNWKQSAPKLLAFLIPLGISMGVAMAINHARFENPFEFGHRHLMILWRARIEKWGLFNYHYLSKNLAVALTSLPWLTTREPHIIISRHGLALWVTTPALLLLLWPKRPIDFRMHTYIWSSCIVALINLLYQNTGWIQFGYRFATDYLTIWFTLLALGRQNLRSFGFLGAAVFAVVVNTFGAITFDRAWQFYDDDPTQERVFQPD